MVAAPDTYADLILVPAILHIDPLTFASYPEILREKMRRLLSHYIANGWAGALDTVKHA